MRKRIVKILFFLGFFLIISSIGLVIYNFYDAARADKSAANVEQVLESKMEEITPSFFQQIEVSQEEVVPEMATMEIDGQLYIGTLEIPSLNMKLPIISDWDKKKLRISPCRFYGSYYTDDLVLCGHNYRGGKHFSPLRNITEGADVYFTTVDGEIIHYKVLRGEKLGGKQVDEMITKTDWDLTLYTCTTTGGLRLTVRCVRV